VAHYVIAVPALLAIGIVWRAFAGQLGLVLGLMTAGLAFAMQEVIGALAGWFNIVSGSIYKVGDRVEVGGVRGDVIDITPPRSCARRPSGCRRPPTRRGPSTRWCATTPWRAPRSNLACS
jgi:hypothetical protein